MNISKYILLLFSLMIMSKSSINEFQLTKLEAETMTSCVASNQSNARNTVSAFVEEVSVSTIYIAEPTRVSINSHLPIEQLQEIEGKWIEIHIFFDQAICFEPDHSKTDSMREKSKLLLRRLQEKSSRSDRDDIQ